MTSTREQDLLHPNERGNGPKKRMEGGDQTDDIGINDPDERLREQRLYKRRKDDASGTGEPTTPQK